MPDRERKKQRRQGPSSQTVDEGLEGAIFVEPDADRNGNSADVRDLDAAATGKGGIAVSRSGEGENPGGTVQEAGEDPGEETPPEIIPS